MIYTINVGIGDIITTKSFLLTQGPCTIQPTHRHLNFRGEGYINFVNSFIKLVFHEPQFTIIPGDNRFEPTHWARFNLDGIEPQHIDLTKVLPLPCEIPSQPYICVNTKVRQYRRSTFESIKAPFIEILKNSPYKIMILGERTIEPNQEYQIHGSEHIFSIYNYLTELPPEKLIDRSVPALGLTNPNLENLRHDCYRMNKSDAVINIGYGGNLALSGSVANTINLIGQNHIYEKSDVIGILNKMFYGRIANYKDDAEFIARLRR